MVRLTTWNDLFNDKTIDRDDLVQMWAEVLPDWEASKLHVPVWWDLFDARDRQTGIVAPRTMEGVREALRRCYPYRAEFHPDGCVVFFGDPGSGMLIARVFPLDCGTCVAVQFFNEANPSAAVYMWRPDDGFYGYLPTPDARELVFTTSFNGEFCQQH